MSHILRNVQFIAKRAFLLAFVAGIFLMFFHTQFGRWPHSLDEMTEALGWPWWVYPAIAAIVVIYDFMREDAHYKK